MLELQVSDYDETVIAYTEDSTLKVTVTDKIRLFKQIDDVNATGWELLDVLPSRREA